MDVSPHIIDSKIASWRKIYWGWGERDGGGERGRGEGDREREEVGEEEGSGREGGVYQNMCIW